jgi:hypothetical protein
MNTRNNSEDGEASGRHCKKIRAAEDNKFNPNKFNINNKRLIEPMRLFVDMV